MKPVRVLILLCALGAAFGAQSIVGCALASGVMAGFALIRNTVSPAPTVAIAWFVPMGPITAGPAGSPDHESHLPVANAR